MKALALLSLSLAVALGMPPFAPGVAQKPVLTEEDKSPLQGDWVPAQGHVVVDEPLPQVRLDSKEQQENLALVPMDMEQSPSMVELEVKVKPEAGVEQEGEVKSEVKKEPELKAEPDVKADPEVKAEPEVKVAQEGKENTEVKVEQELKAQPEVEPEPEVKVDLKANVEPEVNQNLEVMGELEVNVKPEVEMEPDFKVESEVKVELDVEEEPEPEVKHMFNEEERRVQEEFQVKMDLVTETESGQELEERHIDMQRNYEMVDEPIMELEPLDDDNLFGEELSNTDLSEEEKSLRAAFQSQDPLLEEEGLRRERDYVLDSEPIMELEPEMQEEPFLRQRVMPDAAFMEHSLDIMGHEMPPSEEYFPNEEARMRMERGKQLEGSDYLRMEGPGSDFGREEGLYPMVGMPLSEEPAMEDSAVLDGGVQIGVVPRKEKRALIRQGVEPPVEGRLSPRQDKQATRQSCSPAGVMLEGKCYLFFKGPKTAVEAEFFCQEHFPRGHLASINSQHVHREVMNMMLHQNGAYTRTWVGGLRYLETGRFIWLDGSHWSYADWLSGEPNNVANVEDCVELLAQGNGKFNDFTCWEPQAFICSHP